MNDRERAELIDTYGMTAMPWRKRKFCLGMCCWQGKKRTGRGHGPYVFIGRNYVGKESKLAELLPRLEEARRLTREEQKSERRESKSRRSGGARCSHTEHTTG